MNRKLVMNEGEIVALVVSVFGEGNPAALEALLGVEFAYADGRYPSDLEDATPYDGDWSWQDQPVDFATYRRGEEPYFPATYPALALYSFDDDFDRGGSVRTRLLLYIERHELESS